MMRSLQGNELDLVGWTIAGVTLAVSLLLDLWTHRRGRGTSTRAAGIWTAVWVGVGVCFGLVVLWVRGASAMQDYFAAYLIEQSLSLDNLFVFIVIFQSLAIAEDRQHEVLFFGVLGALVLRAVFVFAGSAALARWHWVGVVFGVLLVVAAVRALGSNSTGGKSRVVGWLSRRLPVTEEAHGTEFVIRQGGRWMITPLLLALIGLELTDVMFAIDSVPAALSVSQDRFIVYTSNAFAICGLRSLYLLLNRFLSGLRYLHYGIAAVLLFTGCKMIGQAWLHVPSWLSIVITLSSIALSVGASLLDRGVRRTPASA